MIGTTAENALAARTTLIREFSNFAATIPPKSITSLEMIASGIPAPAAVSHSSLSSVEGEPGYGSSTFTSGISGYGQMEVGTRVLTARATIDVAGAGAFRPFDAAVHGDPILRFTDRVFGEFCRMGGTSSDALPSPVASAFAPWFSMAAKRDAYSAARTQRSL